MDKAICWEMTSSSQGIEGFRLFVADRFLGVQTLTLANERPVWNISGFDSQADATEYALTLTKGYEQSYGATLAVEPGEIILHDAERGSLSHGGAIPPALRARIFTSLQRRRITATS